MSAEQTLTIYFRPAILPARRHAVENELRLALGELFIDELGGGTMLDGSESDLTLLVADIELGVPILRDALRRLRVPRGTVIVQFEPETRQWPVFDEPAPTNVEKKSKWKD